MTEKTSRNATSPSIWEQLWAYAIPYVPETMTASDPTPHEPADVEVDTSLIEEAARAMWAEIKACTAMSGAEILTITLPAPDDAETKFGVNTSDLPQDAHRDLLTTAAALSALLFELPLTRQLELTFMVSSDGTLEFTSLLESHLDNFDPDSPDELSGFFVDLARRLTIAADVSPCGDEGEIRTYLVSGRVGGESLTRPVPATSARQAARAFGAIMDVCFFQEETFERIEAVHLQGVFEDWRS